MSQINYRFASFFVVFAAIVVYQFSFIFALPIFVIALLVLYWYQDLQMSDLTANVPGNSRAQSLVSSIYSWTESAVSSVVIKCKNLTVSRNEPSSHLPIQSSNGPRNTAQESVCSSSDTVIIRSRGNVRVCQSPRSSDNFPKVTASRSSAVTSEGDGHTSKPSTDKDLILFKDFKLSPSTLKPVNSTSRCDGDGYSQRSSPWGFTLSPQQRNSAPDVRCVTAVSPPLSASSRYNANRDSAPGFTSRLLKYHAEAATHQPQYRRPGQLPLVHWNNSPLPSLNSRNSQKVRAPVRVRLAPPTYDTPETRLFNRPDKKPVPEQQSKSIIEVLKEISRKRMHTEDGGNYAKRHHPQSDSSSSSSSSSSPAVINGVLSEQAPTGKRPREEDSPKLQKPTVKRTRNNEIYSSLSSSRNMNVGTKRKAADSWSRCCTPVPIGKHLKKSPYPPSHLSEENDSTKCVNERSHQRESSPLSKFEAERNLPQSVSYGNSPSPSINTARQADPQSSSRRIQEKLDENTGPSNIQQTKNYHGRLFAKTLSRGIPCEPESMKDARGAGTKPWKTQRTIDDEVIIGEDILGQDLQLGSRRLNSMLSALQSNGAESELSKGDTVDAPPSKIDTSKIQSNAAEAKGNSLTDLAEKPPSNPSHISGEQPFITPTPASGDSVSEVPKIVVPTTSSSQTTSPPNFGSISSTLSNSASLIVAKEKNDLIPSSLQVPTSVTSSSTSSNPTSSATSLPLPSIAPSSDLSVVTPSTSTPLVVKPSDQIQSKIITSVASTVPSGLFGSPSTATFTVPQQTEKAPVTTTSTFAFGASTSAGVSSTAVSSSNFAFPTSSSTSTPAVSSLSQPTVAPSFAMLPQNSSTVDSTKVAVSKSDALSSSNGGFSFRASSSAAPSTSTLGGFSMPKTTSSAISFGISNTPTSTFSTTQAVTSSQNVHTTVTTSADSTASKSFRFGVTDPAPVQTSGPTSTGGFNFQFGSSTQSNLAAPKPQENPPGFKFSFSTNKEEGGISVSQPSTNPNAKPPAFGEGFNFGSTSSTANSEENKPMTFGTPTGLTPTMTATPTAPPSGGFNFTADANASTTIPKPNFGFGASNATSGTTGSVLGSSGGGFNFGAKPADPPAVAPASAAPSLGSPFQFGASSQVIPSSTLQPQGQTVNSPFSIGATTEQNQSSVLGGGFSFGTTPSASIPPLQQSTPAFGQSSVASFGSSSINPLQNQQAAPAPSLFQFGSGGSAMAQPGMSSGGFNFGGATAPGAPPSGFNFNSSGPSATTPFQFGANPLQPGMQAPAMFSIGSGSTAPRSRPRNRRQK